MIDKDGDCISTYKYMIFKNREHKTFLSNVFFKNKLVYYENGAYFKWMFLWYIFSAIMYLLRVINTNEILILERVI